ncbi:tRNA pseudouridine(38-40) synthase TruA [bacterium NHP-B]|nr:tRNA pseudouridine(38-40) synthase TruA [bacterium NHP-B]
MSTSSFSGVRYFFVLEYDGRFFCGWQRQKDQKSVQATFEKALSQVTGESQMSYAAGRTDAGVHACAQVAHVTLSRVYDHDRLKRGTNFYLKASGVVVKRVIPVSLDMHARFSACARTYIYIVSNTSYPPVLNDGRVWWVPRPLPAEKIKEASRFLVGSHDFSAFRASHCQAKSPFKTLDHVTIDVHNDAFFFTFSARSFLHNQVRMMVGTLVRVGQKNLPPHHIQRLLQHPDKSMSGPLAPACGLYLTAVSYDNFTISSNSRMIF